MPPTRVSTRVSPIPTSTARNFSRDASGPELDAHAEPDPLFPPRVFSHPVFPHAQPLSLEELVRKREAEAKASARPSFVSKKDREAAALKRREEEGGARRNRGAGTDTRAPPDVRSRSFPFRETTHDDRAFDHRRDGDAFDETRARARTEPIRAQYMGGAKAKKKVTKPSDKFKFKFDWDKDQDTSADLNPLYDRPHESAPVFGRGARAPAWTAASSPRRAPRRQMALVAQSRRDTAPARHGRGGVACGAAARGRSEREARSKGADAKQRHWSEKSAAEMTERDWRIFREDHNITKGRLAPSDANAELPVPGPGCSTTRSCAIRQGWV